MDTFYLHSVSKSIIFLPDEKNTGYPGVARERVNPLEPIVVAVGAASNGTIPKCTILR